MSVRLRLLSAGARLFVKPLFRVSADPVRDAQRLQRLSEAMIVRPPFTLHLPRELGGRPAHWIEGRGVRRSGVILYFHGGGYFAGSGLTHIGLLARLSGYAGAPVFAQDYSLLYESPFPAAFDDAVAAWDDLIQRGYRPSDIVLGGDSAGGGLALAVLARVLGRGERPAGLFAMSPWTDLTLSGGSVQTNAAVDPVLPADRMQAAADAYLKGAAADDPRASPLFADFTAPPPVFLQVGSPEVLEDDTYRMADVLRAAGGDVQVQTWSGAPHVWHLGEYWVPEARAALRDIAGFVQTSLDKANR